VLGRRIRRGRPSARGCLTFQSSKRAGMMPAFPLMASQLQRTIETYSRLTPLRWSSGHSTAKSFNVETGPAQPASPLAWLRVRCALPHRAGSVFVVYTASGVRPRRLRECFCERIVHGRPHYGEPRRPSKWSRSSSERMLQRSKSSSPKARTASWTAAKSSGPSP